MRTKTVLLKICRSVGLGRPNISPNTKATQNETFDDQSAATLPLEGPCPRPLPQWWENKHPLS